MINKRLLLFIGLVLAAVLAGLDGAHTPARAAPMCDDLEYLRTVDRLHAVPADYEPQDLVDLRDMGVAVIGYSSQMRAEPAQAFVRMALAASANNYSLIAISGYRSYAVQRYTFYRWMQGELSAASAAGAPIDEAAAAARANRYSAIAGQSEHQLGSALDVSTRELQGALSPYLPYTETGKWLLAHAHEYGFVVSYPPGKERMTGFNAEPWHLRFVGAAAARELFDLNYLDPQNSVTLGSYLADLNVTACQPFLP
jgi:D-alanyl-D-alanine carboxypeptidase